MRNLKLFAFLIWVTAVTGCSYAENQNLQDGDIIFQRMQSSQCVAIEAATDSQYTHLGLIFMEDGKPFVYEAVQPVRKTPLQAWIQQGRDHHYVVKRLRDYESVNFQAVKQQAAAMLGKNYDALFGWSDNRIYCSELVWKAYQRGADIEVGTLRQLEDFNLEHATVKQLMRQRYGDDVPLKMTVISPADIFDSEKLITVQKS
ncbi:MAG: YiiX family permuted papain-like enzyme [Verrucomicrobiota bacterium]